MQRAEAPVLQLAHKVPGADALGEVELALAVQAQDVLKYPRRPVKVELPVSQRIRIAQLLNACRKKGQYYILIHVLKIGFIFESEKISRFLNKYSFTSWPYLQ